MIGGNIKIRPSFQIGPWGVGTRPEGIGGWQAKCTECSTAEVFASCVDVVLRNVQLSAREANTQPTVSVKSIGLAKLTLDDCREGTSYLGRIDMRGKDV